MTRRLRACGVCRQPTTGYWSASWCRSKYCSVACARAARDRVIRKCSRCNESYTSRGGHPVKFCSRKCWYEQQREKAYCELICGNCGRQFTRRASGRKHAVNFCSRACHSAHNVGPNNAMWRGGSDPNRGASWGKIAEMVRLRDCYQCQRCGKSQEENGQKLSVDHIVPWRQFFEEDPIFASSDANKHWNLVSLCRKCHTWKTTTIERKWLRGDGLALQQYRVQIGMEDMYRPKT